MTKVSSSNREAMKVAPRSSFTPCRSPRDSTGFTLIELLIVIAILIILSLLVFLVLNPFELFRQGRDSTRVSDVKRLSDVTNIHRVLAGGVGPGGAFGVASTIYISVPDSSADPDLGNNCSGISTDLPSLPVNWSYHCVLPSKLRNIDGSGWVPVKFSAISGGSTLGSLPVDPVNDAREGSYYTYVTDGSSSYVLTSLVQSVKYMKDVAQADRGTDDTRYEIGTDFLLWAKAQGLVGLWRFDEGQGVMALDSSYTQNHGTLINNPARTPDGKKGSALTFNGVNTYVDVGNSPTLHPRLGSYSVMAWAKTSVSAPAGQARDIYAVHWADNAAIELRMFDSAGKSFPGFFARVTDGTAATGVTLMNDGGWHHWAGVLDAVADKGKIYIDGALDPGGNSNASYIQVDLNPGTQTFKIGQRGYFLDPSANVFLWVGPIDEVRVYNRALSLKEIQLYYNATR